MSTKEEQETSAVLSRQGALQELQQTYLFKEPSSVAHYVQKYAFLIPLLIKAAPEMRNYFPDAQFFLDVVSDPEEAIPEDELLLWIATSLEPEVAIEKLQQFDRAWWLGALPKAKGKLCISLGRY